MMRFVGGLLFLGGVSAVLALLKLMLFGGMSWFWVFVPLWAPYLIFLGVAIVMLAVEAARRLREAKEARDARR